jgi:diadenosine tetraphosphatase ApaH/serine/threonine PP2A family protein phosphatase
MDEVSTSGSAAHARLTQARSVGLTAGVWHPEKIWAVMRRQDEWFPLTVCREVATLRQEEQLEQRLLAWIRMIQASIDVSRGHGLGLDVNPANFGIDRADSSKLYYLDDEFYDGFGERNIAGAMVARIPEELSVSPKTWKRWGEQLTAQLALGEFSWGSIRDEIRLYPLPAMFESSRASLLSGLPSPQHRSKLAGAGAPRLTCVLADVHANLPALEAVLTEARARGADSYLFLGDAIGYGPFPAECIRVLAELPSAVLVRGNHDHAIATGHFEQGMNSLARQTAEWTRAALGKADLAWLAKLPTDHVADGWLAVHGAPRDPYRFLAYVYELTYEDNLRYLRDHRIPLCFYGHTHVQLTHVELAAGPAKLPGCRSTQIDPKHQYLVNPGSVGQPRDGDSRAAYALWHRADNTVETLRIAYDVERTITAIHAAALPSQLEHRLRVGS